MCRSDDSSEDRDPGVAVSTTGDGARLQNSQGLNTSYNPVTSSQEDTATTGMQTRGSANVNTLDMEEVVFNTKIASDPGEPKIYKAAMKNEQRTLWEAATREEIYSFRKKKSWKMVNRSSEKGNSVQVGF